MTTSVLFLPGLDDLAAPDAPRLPALERLLAHARSVPGGSCWAALARLAGGDLVRWPVGPVSALAELEHAPADCLRVEPIGMDAEQRGAFRMRAQALNIRLEEALALAEAFAATFAGDGLRLEVATPERWYLVRDTSVHDAPWAGFDGPAVALAPGQRPAPPEAGLRRLLSEVEMLFFAHPVNEARRELGRPLVAGLHPWGGGRLDRAALAAGLAAAPPAAAPAAAVRAGEPYLAGLRRLGVLPYATGAGAFELLWPLAPEDMDLARLRAVDADIVAGLSQQLRRGRIRRLRLVTGRAEHEASTLGMLRFWRRRSHWAAAC